MGPFVLAWLIGESIVVYRWTAKLHAPPPPGALALSSLVFVGLAVVAEYQPARGFATATAFAYDLAILLQITGKTPAGPSGWPPPLINDPSVILPGTPASVGQASTPAAAKPAPAGGGVGSVIRNIWDSLA